MPNLAKSWTPRRRTRFFTRGTAVAVCSREVVAMGKVVVNLPITEDNIIMAMQDAPASGWPQDEAELADLFNHILRSMTATIEPQETARAASAS